MQDNMKATEDAEEKKGGERKKESEREGGMRRGREGRGEGGRHAESLCLAAALQSAF